MKKTLEESIKILTDTIVSGEVDKEKLLLVVGVLEGLLILEIVRS